MFKSSGRQIDLARDSIPGLMVKLALPSVIAQTINMLYNMVDRIYIGSIEGVGAYALTGVGLTLPVITLISAFSSLFGTGGAPLASIKLGEGKRQDAERILGVSSFMLLCTSAVLFIFFQLAMNPLLMAFGASENTLPYASAYLRVYLLGTAFVQLVLGLNPFISAQGFAKEAMLSVVIGAALNIALDPLFIFVMGMGVRGAALATIISQGFSCLWVLRFLSGPRTLIRIRRRNLRIRPKVVLPCVALGLSPFSMQASESVISVCFNSSLLRYGGDVAVGAMTILTSVMQFAMLPLQGVAQGAQPITSYNYGARNAGRVRQTYRLLLTVSLTYSSVLWALIQLCPRAFVSIFTPDPALIEFASGALRVYCAALCIFGIQIACQMTFVAIGSASSSILVAVMRKFVLLLPLIYIMPRLVENQTMGVYMAEPVADVLAVTFTAILFAVRFTKAMKRISEPQNG